MDNKKLKILYFAIIGAIIAIVFVAAITIFAELVLPIKDFLKNTFSHHWIGKGVVAAGIFVIITAFGLMLPTRINERKISFWLWSLIALTIISFLALTSFFIYEALLVK